MKKVIKGMVALGLVFTTATATANEPKVKVSTSSETKSILLTMDTPSENTQIWLTDSENNIIHYENMEEGAYLKKLNLDQLENGLYKLMVQNTTKELFYDLKLNSNGIIIVAKEQTTKIPVLRKSGDRIYLNLLNGDLNPVRVKIYNGNNQEVEEQLFNDNFTVGKVFNFANALSDTYSIVVEDGTKTYREDIVVR